MESSTTERLEYFYENQKNSWRIEFKKSIKDVDGGDVNEGLYELIEKVWGEIQLIDDTEKKLNIISSLMWESMPGERSKAVNMKLFGMDLSLSCQGLVDKNLINELQIMIKNSK